MKRHELKTWPESFQPIRQGVKTAEFRRNTDRQFRVGEILTLKEYDPMSDRYTGEELEVEITHILDHGYGIPDGFCMLSIRLLHGASV